MASSLFEQLGGQPILQAIIDDFVDRLFDDQMIGYMFRRAPRERIKRFEYEHAAEHLGGDISYGGRPLAETHAPHRIMGGQFARRREILRQVLVARQAPQNIIDHWLAHTDSLRPLITADRGGECIG